VEFECLFACILPLLVGGGGKLLGGFSRSVPEGAGFFSSEVPELSCFLGCSFFEVASFFLGGGDAALAPVRRPCSLMGGCDRCAGGWLRNLPPRRHYGAVRQRDEAVLKNLQKDKYFTKQ